MDTSLSKALIMVASVLLAMIVIAFITFSFSRMGTWATTQNDEQITEQKQKFNKEYEAYDKDLMYGVDIISCLNKAKSNNDAISGKYAEQKDSSYEVKVKVILKSNKLTESLEVYYRPNTVNSFSRKENYSYSNGNGVSDVTLEDAGFNFINNSSYMKISKFKKDAKLKTHTDYEVQLQNKELTLTKSSSENDDIIKLLSASNSVSEIRKNPENATHGKWTDAEFKSALYDLKTRKFKCTSLTYSDAGRVNYIEFKEL